MNAYLSSMLLTVASNVGYHLFQKEIRPDVPPFLSLAVSYLVGLLVTVSILLFFPSLSGPLEWRTLGKVNWASYALGLALVGLELGFLLAYRSGWRISYAALISNVGVTLLLLPIGILFYRESVSLSKILGLLLSLSGLWLLGKR